MSQLNDLSPDMGFAFDLLVCVPVFAHIPNVYSLEGLSPVVRLSPQYPRPDMHHAKINKFLINVMLLLLSARHDESGNISRHVETSQS
jgi:hypothetical protein